MDWVGEHLLHPRKCKCGEIHFKATHPDIIDFYREFEEYPGQAQEMMGKLDEQMLKEYDPSTDVPGRPLKYVSKEDKRRANTEYQRRWREKQRKQYKALDSIQETLDQDDKSGADTPT